MKVQATQDGFYAGEFRAKGAVFEFAGRKPGKWMQPIEGGDKAKGAAKAEPKAAKSPEDAKPPVGSASDGGKVEI